MSKESLEHLSSLMDGELSRETSLFMTRRFSSDDGLCETWERYHLIRDCIRQPGSKQLVTGLCARINSSLEEEDAPVISPWNRNRWLKPVSGLSIAASVALMAIVITAPQPGALPVVDDTALSGSANQPFVSPNSSPLPMEAVSQPVSYSSAQSNRLNAYLLRHNQMARTAGRQGFVSFVPIVAAPAAADRETVEEETGPETTLSEMEAAENK
jgi:sigma-E factor negative regulatory protein RseA